MRKTLVQTLLAAFCAILAAVVEGGGIMLPGARMFFGSGKWKNPYVTDGLVAMWDGEWNAGSGKHDASATTWKDIVSGVSFALTNATWGSSALLLRSNVYGFLDATGTTTTFGAIQGGGTMEICALANSYMQSSTLLKSTADVSFNFNASNRINFRNSNAPQSRGSFLLADTLRTISCVYGSGTSIEGIYANGVASSFDGTNNTGGYAAGGTLLGCRSSSSSSLSPTRFCDLDIYGIRLYSRALTAAEVAFNYAIDQRRFNIS